MSGQAGEFHEFNSKLIPILREGVEIIKMILYKELRTSLARRYPEKDSARLGKLTGAVVNALFGTPNPQPEFAAFIQENKTWLEEELQGLATELERLRIPLTDALRIQFLCDSMQGMESTATLTSARNLGVLLPQRQTPLPRNFLELVRRLGRSYGLLPPQTTSENG